MGSFGVRIRGVRRPADADGLTRSSPAAHCFRAVLMWIYLALTIRQWSLATLAIVIKIAVLPADTKYHLVDFFKR